MPNNIPLGYSPTNPAQPVNPWTDQQFMSLLGASMLGSISPLWAQQGNWATPAINAWSQNQAQNQINPYQQQSLALRAQELQQDQDWRQKQYGLDERRAAATEASAKSQGEYRGAAIEEMESRKKARAVLNKTRVGKLCQEMEFITGEPCTQEQIDYYLGQEDVAPTNDSIYTPEYCSMAIEQWDALSPDAKKKSLTDEDAAYTMEAIRRCMPDRVDEIKSLLAPAAAPEVTPATTPAAPAPTPPKGSAPAPARTGKQTGETIRGGR